MKSSYLSAPVMGFNPSLVPIVAGDSRVSAISRDDPKRTKVRGVGLAFLLAAFVGWCVTSELCAQVIVVPNSLATNDGNVSVAAPAGGPNSLREMRIFDAAQFGALSGPSFLTQFAWRPDATPGPRGPRTLALRIFASTTSRSVAGLSRSFAENIGVDNTLVFNGTLIWATANLPGPGNTRQFDVVFHFTTPFLYDPAAGNLLLEMQFSANGEAITVDGVSGNSAVNKTQVFGSSTAPTGDFGIPQVTQFTFEPAPPATPTFSDANWSSMDGFAGAIGGAVSAAVVDGSGNLYIAGLFNVAGEVVNVAKWNGSSWTPLGSEMDGEVSALAVLGSDLYAGGWFTTAGGKGSASIARAYLPVLPTLSVRRTGGSVTVSWPTVDTAGFALEQAGPLAAPADWVPNSAAVTDDGAKKSVTLPTTNSSQLFRLRRP